MILISIVPIAWNTWYEATNVPTWFEYVMINGAIILAQSSTGGNTMYFAGQSANRTIHINFVAREGTFDCIVLVSKQYSEETGT